MTMYGPKYCLESLPDPGERGLWQTTTIKLETYIARVISVQGYTEVRGRCGDDGILSDIHNSLIPGQEGTSEYVGCVREGKQERPL